MLLGLVLGLPSAGCGSCQEGPPAETAGRRADTLCPLPRGRPPHNRAWKVGSLALSEHGRTLRVDHLPTSFRLAAFAGPAPSTEPLDPAVAALKKKRPALAVLLGGAGDTEDLATHSLEALAGLGVPVFVIAGGRDDDAVLDRAFGALDQAQAGRVIDARPCAASGSATRSSSRSPARRAAGTPGAPPPADSGAAT